jgi:S-DNA-T family DNA segregation ATPase FtsK/SpoIIIE
MIKYLLGVLKERNTKLDKYNLNNIDEYNSRFPDDKQNYVYLVFDEFASITPGEKSVDLLYAIKSRIIFNLLELMRQARSAGIFILASLQRPDKANLDPNIKNLFNIKVAFRANNKASAKVLTDDEECYNLPNRQAIFMGSFNKSLKTPYIDDKLIAGLLKEKYENDHKYVEIYPKKKEEGVQDQGVEVSKQEELKPKEKGVKKKNAKSKG